MAFPMPATDSVSSLRMAGGRPAARHALYDLRPWIRRPSTDQKTRTPAQAGPDGNSVDGRGSGGDHSPVDFTDADAAALYDLLNPWDPTSWPGDAFYTGLVMAADSVLDVGCGTGSMLKHARGLGHAGRLAGIDPDVAMLERARTRTDIEWVEG